MMEIAEGISLRQAVPSDIDAIMKVEKEAFHSEIIEDQAVFLERIETFSSGFLVLEQSIEEKSIIGYICGELWRFSENPEHYTFTLGHSIKEVLDTRGTELYIASMGLLKSSRKSGLGIKMMTGYINHMHKSWPEMKSVVLIVCESWAPARKIYKDLGFSEIAEIKGFFDFGEVGMKETGIIMRKYMKELK